MTIPTFFVPHVEDSGEAERFWQATKTFLESNGFRVSDRRIYRVSYSHDGTKYHDVVGSVSSLAGEEVLVILDAGKVFLACTENRGVMRGMPVIIGKHRDTHAEDFSV